MIDVTKLPPGEAYGAKDLQNWSTRRNAGKCGVRDDRKAYKRWVKAATVKPDRSGWYNEALKLLAYKTSFNQKERSFIESVLCWKGIPTEKQLDWLYLLIERVNT